MVKILLATDGSECAVRAARKLVEMMPCFKEVPEVHLINVREPLLLRGVYLTAVTRDVVQRSYEEEGELALTTSAKVLDDAKVQYTAEVLVGDVPQTIAQHAVRAGCAMIFMGTRGLTAISNLVLGSVATKLLHLADVPVVLVR